ncbi:hypothetical protein VR41_09155 [Streptomyces sp. NRRL B-1568]|nr:hypothetical protein VR41_09155 [Streptomyces sp. NRRL B-1568]
MQGRCARRQPAGVTSLRFRFPCGETTPRQITEVNALGFADLRDLLGARAHAKGPPGPSDA